MPKIPIPGTDEEINTDNPVSAVVSVGLLVVGFAIAFIAAMGGQWLYNKIASVSPADQAEVF